MSKYLGNYLSNYLDMQFYFISFTRMIQKELKWLKSKSGYIKIFQIEKELDLPEGTLKKYVDERRDLPEKWKPKVIEWIKKFKK